MRDALESKFSVVDYHIGEKSEKGTALDFRDAQTNLHEFIKLQQQTFEGQNLAAVVLASDGIYNKGLNPEYSLKNQKVPIHTIRMGDSTVRKDAAVASVRANKIAYLGNRFPILVDVNIKQASGERVELSVWRNQQKLKSEFIDVNKEGFAKSLPFQLDADKTGMQHYQVRLSSVSGERYLGNNQQSVYIEVLDSRQKILLCASAAHPDIGALRRSIEANENYDFQLRIGSLPTEQDLKDNSLVILHQYPSSSADVGIIQKMMSKKTPILFVLGAQTNMNAYSRLEPAMAITGSKRALNESSPELNSDFLLFELSDDLKNRFSEFPPLFCPYGDYSVNRKNNVLFHQKIGVVPTNYPLIYLSNEEGYRTGFICGEGWWRWSMTEYRTSGNADATNELLSKLLQYLSVKKDQRKLRVETRKKSYSENEKIVIDAQLYNDNYELMNTPDLSLEILGSSGKKYPFVFGKNSQSYKIEVGRLPADQYSFVAKGTFNGKTVTSSGLFTVKKLEAELMNLQADHRLLRKISNSSNGFSYSVEQFDDLTNMLLNDNSLVPIRYSSNSFKELLHQKWIFALLVLLLSIEWFVRKWNSI